MRSMRRHYKTASVNHRNIPQEIIFTPAAETDGYLMESARDVQPGESIAARRTAH